MRTLILALSLLLLSPPGGRSAWGNGVCYPSPAVVGFPPHIVIHQPVVKPCPCSVNCTCGCNEGKVCECNGPAKTAADSPLFGVEDDKRNGKDGFKLNGKPVSREAAFHLIEKDLPDDKQKPRLTLIGSPDDTKRAREKLKGSDIESACLIQCYTPDNWAVRDVGFTLVGSPAVYLQAPDGKVLHKQADDSGMVEALRKRILPNSPVSPPGGKSLTDQLKAVPMWIWLVAGGMLLLVLNKKEEKK